MADKYIGKTYTAFDLVVPIVTDLPALSGEVAGFRVQMVYYDILRLQVTGYDARSNHYHCDLITTDENDGYSLPVQYATMEAIAEGRHHG